MYFVLSAFTSSQVSLVATTKASGFSLYTRKMSPFYTPINHVDYLSFRSLYNTHMQNATIETGPVQFSRYSDWLRAGRSGDRMPLGGGEIFRTCPDRPWGPPSLLYKGYRVFPGGKERLGCDTDPSPPSSAVVNKE